VIRGTTRHYVSIEFHNWLVLAGFRQAKSGLSGEISAKMDDKNLACPDQPLSVYWTILLSVKMVCCQI